MRQVLLALGFCLALLIGPVWAQEVPSTGTPALSSLDLALWPEYDRPEMLVIYHGQFAPDTPLPVPVEIWLPARVGQPTAVAYVDEGGQRINQEYSTRVEGDQLVVSFDLSTPGFQLEYYDPLPTDSAGKRTYPYAYTADYAIAALSLEVQEPPTAVQFTMDPPADSTDLGADGLTYHRVGPVAVDQNDTKTWTITYQKPDSALTVETLAPEATVAPAAPATPPDADSSAVLIFFVAFVALVAVGAAAFWLGRRTQPIDSAPPPPAQRAGPRGSRPQPSPRVPGERTLFCHTCGAQLRSDSDFCHKCGSAVRKQ